MQYVCCQWILRKQTLLCTRGSDFPYTHLYGNNMLIRFHEVNKGAKVAARLDRDTIYPV
jgi:hypothetical protein